MRSSGPSRSKDRPPAPVPETAARAAWICGTVLALATLLAYGNSLSGPFVFDDILSVVENQGIHDLSRLGDVLRPERELPTAGRPLVNLSFAMNYAAGGLSVTGYHVVNLAFHIGSALLVFGIVRRTVALPAINASRGQADGVALAVALLWALHPLNTEAVNYVTQRSELMMALCYLLTLYAALRAWDSPTTGRWAAIATAACAMGMACKESMATAPLMVALYDRVFLFESFTQALKSRRRLYVGLSMSWIVLAFMMWSGPRMRSAGFSSGVSPWTYLLNQGVLIVRYLGLAFWPRDLVATYGWPVPIAFRDAAPYLLIVGGLAALTAVGLFRRPKWGFLGAWFFVTLAPTSSIVPIATEVGAERRMYLPLIAVVTSVVLVCARLASRSGRNGRTATVAALVIVSMALATGTFLRNRDYRSALVLARTSVERYPSSVGHHALGAELILAGDREQGLTELRAALPGAPRAHYTLGIELLKDGQDEAAAMELEAFLREQPMLVEAVSARQLLGRALARQKRWPEAAAQYQQALTMNPSGQMRIDTQALLGEALYNQGRFAEAAAAYSEHLKGQPGNVDALNVLGICLLALERQDEAIGTFTRAVNIDPENGISRRNLGNALFDAGAIDAAAVHAEEATRLRIDDPGAWDLLGRVSAVKGDLRAAQDDFARALRLDPNFSDAKEHLQAVEQLLLRRPPAPR